MSNEPGIKCPECGSSASSVVDSREIVGGIRRRRSCENCGGRYSTCEIMRARLDGFINNYSKISQLIQQAEELKLRAASLENYLVGDNVLPIEAPASEKPVPLCHPERDNFAKGMCRKCYHREYNRIRKAKALEVSR